MYTHDLLQTCTSMVMDFCVCCCIELPKEKMKILSEESAEHLNIFLEVLKCWVEDSNKKTENVICAYT